MNLFVIYIRQRIKGIAALLLFCIIFGVSFVLYHLPIKAIVYPAFLCALLGIIFVLGDFAGARKKHLRLSEIQKLTASMISSFPNVESMEDEDYQAIIKALQAEIESIETTANAQYQNMIEYYTIWAHQIKTPIASMRLNLQNEDSAVARRLSSDLFRIEQYVEMVLAFLRLGSASTDYVFREYEFDMLVKNSVKICL